LKFLLKNEWTVGLLAAVLFIPFLGHVHLFDWDEINFAESAREMIESGNYFSVQINYQQFWEKPPLFFWMQVLSMKAFGINEFAARFPNAVCGIITLICLFRIGKRLYSKTFGRIWVIIYLGTFLSFFYFKSGIIDPWFNLFIFLGIYYFHFLTFKSTVNRLWYAFLTGLFIGLAVLTKGPVALLICLLSYSVYILTHYFNNRKIFSSLVSSPLGRRGGAFINWKELLLIIFTIIIICFAWFGVDLIKNGPGFLREFIQYQIRLLTTSEADHGEPFFYHWVVLLIGCFPASIFMMKGMFSSTPTSPFKKWMIILFWVVLLLFSIVKTKIVHYSSLCYFPITYLATVALYNLNQQKIKLSPILTILLSIIGLLLATTFAAIPFIMMYKNAWIDSVHDIFAKGNLEANVHWVWTDGLGGIILLAGIVVYLLSKQKKTIFLFASVTACCFLTTILIAPKIEAISQRANIDFFERKQYEDCYITTYNYRSYAIYFYAKKKPFENKLSTNDDWLLHGNIDKPVYISAKIQNMQVLDAIPDLQKLYIKNGFVFYKRLPVSVQH